jgi:hypothetical protein
MLGSRLPPTVCAHAYTTSVAMFRGVRLRRQRRDRARGTAAGERSWHASCFRNRQKPQSSITNLHQHGLTASRGSQQARRQMMEDVMAKVIEFYVSDSLPGKSNYIARKESRKLIEFRVPKRNQANSNSAQWPGMCMAYIGPFAGTLRAVEPTTPCEHYGKRGGDPDEEPR